MADSGNHELIPEEERKILIKKATDLVDNIRVSDGFLTALRTEEVFSTRQLERIERKYKNDGTAEANEEILKLLDRCSKKSFEGFKRALMANDQAHIVRTYLTVTQENTYQQEHMQLK